MFFSLYGQSRGQTNCFSAWNLSKLFSFSIFWAHTLGNSRTLEWPDSTGSCKWYQFSLFLPNVPHGFLIFGSNFILFLKNMLMLVESIYCIFKNSWTVLKFSEHSHREDYAFIQLRWVFFSFFFGKNSYIPWMWTSKYLHDADDNTHQLPCAFWWGLDELPAWPNPA